MLSYSLMTTGVVWLNIQLDVHDAYGNNIALVFIAAILSTQISKSKKGLTASKYWLSVFAGSNYTIASYLIFYLADKPTFDAVHWLTTFVIAFVLIILLAKYKVI